MHGASVVDEVQTRPGIPSEEFGRKQIAFEAIASATCGNEIAGGVHTALCKRMDVIDGGDVEVEGGGAVHTAPSAITHHGVLDRTLLVAAGGALRALGAS